MPLPLSPVPFREALEYALGRKVELPETYYGKRINAQRAQAFSVAGLTELSQIQKVLDSLNEHLASGASFADWRAKVTSGDIGLDLPDGRLDNIFRTNIQAAYANGRYTQQTDPVTLKLRPYWMYDAINDSRTRPTHHAMDNTVLPASDPWWLTHYPPNGFRCRCTVISLSVKQAQKRGISTSYPDNAVVDPGFGYNPGTDYATGVEKSLVKAAAKSPKAKPVVAKVVKEAKAKDLTLAEVQALGKKAVDEIMAQPDVARYARWAQVDGNSTKSAYRMAVQGHILDRMAKLPGAKDNLTADTFAKSTSRGLMGQVDSALGKMPPAWRKALNSYWNVKQDYALKLTPVTDRAHFSSQAHEIVNREGDPDTMLHELTHAVQHAAPQVDTYFQQYWVERTKGEELVPLKSVYPTANYRTDERTKKDKWFHAYVGKFYPGYKNDLGAMEVMTMAMEYGMGGSTIKWAQLLDNDRDLFHLLVGVLLHV